MIIINNRKNILTKKKDRKIEVFQLKIYIFENNYTLKPILVKKKISFSIEENLVQRIKINFSLQKLIVLQILR